MFEVSHIPTERYVAIMKGLWRVVFFVLVKVPLWVMGIGVLCWIAVTAFQWIFGESGILNEMTFGVRMSVYAVGIVFCFGGAYLLGKVEKRLKK